jgi:hypothetical protein
LIHESDAPQINYKYRKRCAPVKISPKEEHQLEISAPATRFFSLFLYCLNTLPEYPKQEYALNTKAKAMVVLATCSSSGRITLKRKVSDFLERKENEFDETVLFSWSCSG